MIKAIIFDFDGVLVDSLEMAFDANNVLYAKYGNRTCQDINEFRTNLTFLSFDEHFGKYGFKLDKPATTFGEFYHNYYLNNKHKMKPIKAMVPVLKKLAQKYKLAVVSSSWDKVIKNTLKDHGILDHFEHVLAIENFNSKTERINQSLKLLDIQPHEAIYVGDMVDDIKSGRKSQVKTIIISNEMSWSRKEDILKNNPEILVEHPEQILEAIKNDR